MDLEELYAPNHIERLKARSFLKPPKQKSQTSLVFGMNASNL